MKVAYTNSKGQVSTAYLDDEASADYYTEHLGQPVNGVEKHTDLPVTVAWNGTDWTTVGHEHDWKWETSVWTCQGCGLKVND